MQMTRFSIEGGRVIDLRPAIVERLAIQLRRQPRTEGEGVAMHAGDLADAAGRARDTYRCRHARRDLRQLSLLAVEAVAAKREVLALGAEAETALLRSAGRG